MYKDMDIYGPPVDLSFRSLNQVSDTLAVKPRNRQRYTKTNSAGKYVSCSMILNNNNLKNLIGLQDILSHFLVQPLKLMWLDVSFNQLKNIDPFLSELFELRVLYLHGNAIERMTDVDSLRELQHLRTITLHGNDIESKKGYRRYVVSTLPQLKMLDFSAVTRDERVMADVWFHPKNQQKRANEI
ncbi:leucine-rich repeat-containing protein 51-like [Echeneis naucrates]|uniref:leucine-rich repeat-containing protein 51-like n=1 Tax=Echeneis naucrates TaxID=173247 RepID=UPI001114514D|nr:leucine-rich repeat-containing protein 51-like [Echeneis naucrates]